MQLTALAVLLFVGAVSADTEHGDAEGGYHELVGIPTAKLIKAREDRIHSEAKTREGKTFISSPGNYAFFGGLIINTKGRTGSYHESVCGSSLVTSERLVTAAHCWDDGHHAATDMTAVLGSSFLYYEGVRMQTSKVVTHPNWNSFTQHDDIAIIYLPNKVNFDSSIFPVALPEEAEITQEWDLQYASAFGFGDTEKLKETNIVGPSLQTNVVEIISNEKCSKQMMHLWLDPPSMKQMCSSGKGPCYRDIGGPLVTYTNRKFLVHTAAHQTIHVDLETAFMPYVGIISYAEGLKCGQGKPNVYTRVGMYMDFIASHANLPKFEFHFKVLGDGKTLENITVHIPDTE